MTKTLKNTNAKIIMLMIYIVMIQTAGKMHSAGNSQSIYPTRCKVQYKMRRKGKERRTKPSIINVPISVVVFPRSMEGVT